MLKNLRFKVGEITYFFKISKLAWNYYLGRYYPVAKLVNKNTTNSKCKHKFDGVKKEEKKYLEERIKW